MTVLLNALRGGRAEWHVIIGSTEYTDGLISVKGIEKRAHLDGSYTSATVTIELYGEANIAVGQGVSVKLFDHSLTAPINVWAGTVKTIKNLTAGTLQITCKGALSDFNQDFSFAYPRSSQPRWLYNYILQSALPRGWSENASLPYNDNYHRENCRLSAKYSTLGKLSGVASVGSLTIRGQRWTASSASYSTTWSRSLSGVRMWDFTDWRTYINEDNYRATAPSSPLVWHRTLSNLVNFSTYIRPQKGNSASAYSYWILGQDRYMISNLTIGSFSIYPALELGVTSSDDVQPEESYASYRGTDTDALWDYSSWNPPSSARVSDSKEFDLAIGTKDQPEGQIIYGDISKAQFSGKITYIHPNLTSELQTNFRSYGPSSQYQLSQGLSLATINAEPFTYSQMQQVALLGSLSIVEAGENLSSSGSLVKGYRYTDVCPEKGTIFEIPICKSTCSEVSFIQENPLPPSAKVNFRDPMGHEYSYNVPLESGSTAEPITIDIMQGQLMGGSKNYGGHSGAPEYSLWSNSWDENPGALIDRWTGVGMPGLAPSFTYFAGDGYNVDLRIQNQDGTQAWLEHNLETGAVAYDTTSDYCVTETTNAKRYTFCLYGRIKTKTSSGSNFTLPVKKTPWLDIYPLTQYWRANHRVFPEGRDAWSVRVPLAFVAAEPGNVVIVDLPEIKSEPWLALITSVRCDSDSPEVTLEIIPMFPASGASSSNWPNLSEILRIATSSDASQSGIPYLPGNNLVKSVEQ